MKQKKIISSQTETLLVGIDWADQEHALCLITPDGTTKHLTLKQDVDDIHEYLLLKGVEAVSIHGGKDQEERNEAMSLGTYYRYLGCLGSACSRSLSPDLNVTLSVG